MEGIVIKSTGKLHTVLDNNGNLLIVKPKGSVKLKNCSFTNPILLVTEYYLL